MSRSYSNQPSTTGLTGRTTAASSTELAKLGKNGLADGFRPDPGVTDVGEEELMPGDAPGGNSFPPGDEGLLTGEEEDEDFLNCFWDDLASLGWNSCAVVLGERRGAGLGVSKDIPKGKGWPDAPTSLKSKSSLLLLVRESFRSHEASEGDRGGAEATTSTFEEWPGLDWEAGLKAEVSSSGAQDS